MLLQHVEHLWISLFTTHRRICAARERAPSGRVPATHELFGAVASVWYMYVRQPGQRADSTKDILRMKKQNREIKTSPDFLKSAVFPHRYVHTDLIYIHTSQNRETSARRARTASKRAGSAATAHQTRHWPGKSDWRTSTTCAKRHIAHTASGHRARTREEQRPNRNSLPEQSARQTCLRPGHVPSSARHESPVLG